MTERRLSHRVVGGSSRGSGRMRHESVAVERITVSISDGRRPPATWEEVEAARALVVVGSPFPCIWIECRVCPLPQRSSREQRKPEPGVPVCTRLGTAA